MRQSFRFFMKRNLVVPLLLFGTPAFGADEESFEGSFESPRIDTQGQCVEVPEWQKSTLRFQASSEVYWLQCATRGMKIAYIRHEEKQVCDEAEGYFYVLTTYFG